MIQSAQPRQAGVWRGGVSIFARAYFHVYNMDRKAHTLPSE